MIEKNNEQNEELDEFYYHEALDRSYIIENMIDDLLVWHPVIQKHEELKTRIETAQQLIIEAYQLVGGLSIKLFAEPLDKSENE